MMGTMNEGWITNHFLSEFTLTNICVIPGKSESRSFSCWSILGKICGFGGRVLGLGYSSG